MKKLSSPPLARSPLAPSKPPRLYPVDGIKLAVAASGMKYQSRNDVMLMVADDTAVVAGTLTQSKTCSAAIDWCKSVLIKGKSRAILVNAGNANAFTGKQGAASVNRCADKTAAAIDDRPDRILLASTGVIGEEMEDRLITDQLPSMTASLADDGWAAAAAAIMTTDTFAKASSTKVMIDGTNITITGIAKGSGMIAPDMATMLAFIGTDANISASDLAPITHNTTDVSFNAITVDGDTSTSDTVIVMATGKAAGKTGAPLTGDGLTSFAAALKLVMVDLAQQIIRDGEGASKFVTIDVTGAIGSGAKADAAARRVGLAIANSPLVKTAIAGEDANWGRVVMAVGKSGEAADRDLLSISIGNIVIAKDGQRINGFDEAPVAEHMKGQNILIAVDLGLGNGRARVWTCDLTHGYIDINADYRS
ncbi:MAG: bifunctional glutamate N-acetyltransferase/amino-acid acetyltransferase ArgJ [Candidatus Puniceispirillales bacterium WSBS_2018_MAG_OTU23]